MSSAMTVKFWGVRGSIPSPGANTARYGGNTPCVSIRHAGSGVLVLDAGTGIRELGKAIAGGDEEIFILLSHPHWDHIQGFPFFLPIYEPNRKIFMFPTRFGPNSICGLCQKAKAAGDLAIRCPLLEQMDGAHFPVISQEIPSQPKCVTDEEMSFLRSRGFQIAAVPANHPGGSFGYRIENQGVSVVYLTDNELDPPYEKETDLAGFANFCRNADVLIHDAQYLPNDMPHKRGWGHSLVQQACELALEANARHLVLYHHDPDRNDEELDRIQDEARKWFSQQRRQVQCTVAFEGLSLVM